jgi:hypothetical protein
MKFTRKRKVFTSKSLPLTGSISINEGFPLGTAWRKAFLRLNVTHNASTTGTAIADGVSLFLKSLSIRDSRGEYRYRNMPGRAIMLRAGVLDKTAPVQDTVTNAPATYSAIFPIHFSNPLNTNPDDTIYNTYGLDNVYLDLNLGTIADLNSSGAITAVTADMWIEEAYGVWLINPAAYPEVSCLPAVALASQSEYRMEKNNLLYLCRLFADTRNSYVNLGEAFSGTAASTTLASLTLESEKMKYHDEEAFAVNNAAVKGSYSLPNAITGLNMIDLIKGSSLGESLWTGDLSTLRLTWSNGSLSTSQLSLIQECLRSRGVNVK